MSRKTICKHPKCAVTFYKDDNPTMPAASLFVWSSCHNFQRLRFDYTKEYRKQHTISPTKHNIIVHRRLRKVIVEQSITWWSNNIGYQYFKRRKYWIFETTNEDKSTTRISLGDSKEELCFEWAGERKQIFILWLEFSARCRILCIFSRGMNTNFTKKTWPTTWTKRYFFIYLIWTIL